MPKVDITNAGAEAAGQLGLPLEPATEETPVQETVESPGAVEEATPEGVEPEETTPPPKKAETIPLQRFNEVYGRMKELERTLLEIAKSDRRPAPQQPQEEEPDWDTMSNKEVAHYLMSRIGSKVGEIMQKTVGPVQSQVEADRVARDIQATSTKYPDFWDYREKMVSIAERHPTLTAEEAYHLASGNPSAVKKSVASRVAAQVQKKKAARTEMRSSPSERVAENTQYKSVKEAGLAAAKKLGMI